MSSTVKSKLGWDSLVFYPDDSANMAGFGLAALEHDSVDPWKIKNSLVDLDQMLAKKGEMIGALLIAGGPDIVPYHRLPNPTDDIDDAVSSDNPYGAIDGNYFVQEWPVGRITALRAMMQVCSSARFDLQLHITNPKMRAYLLAAFVEPDADFSAYEKV